MSRCFPYPPPVYTLNRANNEALIESIKLQKERGKAKEKKQRKPEKKQEKKERKGAKAKAHQNLDKADIVHGHIGEKLWANNKSKLLHKECEPEPEQLERSTLTEDHGYAARVNPPSCSSDSTENSNNKRKRQCSPEDVNCKRGKIIRIRLTKKPDDSSASIKQQLPSTSGRIPSVSQHKNDVDLMHPRQYSCSTSNEPRRISQSSAHRIDGEKMQSTSQQIKPAVPPSKISLGRAHRIDGDKMQSTSQQIKPAVPPGKISQSNGHRIDGEKMQSTSQQIKPAVPPRKISQSSAHRIDGDKMQSTSQQIKPAVPPGRISQSSGHRIDGEKMQSTSQQIKPAVPPRKISQSSAHRIDGEKIQSTSQQTKPAVPLTKSVIMTPMQKMELEYKNLFENLTLPLLPEAASLPDDQDWLFQRKNQDRNTNIKKISRNVRMPSSGSQTLWPRAHYLQEVDVYALPYTVPF
ncbi:uncharacterized protein LOC127246319 [Andrographis paniculata]|uniref:uncharacterized protein LOC127246319 n=1 Tax=Andrographis paniculata TaxID=175694 RepID=UPI0021E97D56|nr:uncharacterized protein LOC127246319 [Andrographis paniculata]